MLCTPRIGAASNCSALHLLLLDGEGHETELPLPQGHELLDGGQHHVAHAVRSQQVLQRLMGQGMQLEPAAAANVRVLAEPAVVRAIGPYQRPSAWPPGTPRDYSGLQWSKARGAPR